MAAASTFEVQSPLRHKVDARSLVAVKSGAFAVITAAAVSFVVIAAAAVAVGVTLGLKSQPVTQSLLLNATSPFTSSASSTASVLSSLGSSSVSSGASVGLIASPGVTSVVSTSSTPSQQLSPSTVASISAAAATASSTVTAQSSRSASTPASTLTASAAASASVLRSPCSFLPGPSVTSIVCSSFSVSLASNNGAIVGLYNAQGLLVSPGSRHGCLFGASGPNETYCGSCGCPDIEPMIMQWLNQSDPRVPAASGGVLIMQFPASGAGFSANVTLTTLPAASAFDLTFMLTSAPTSGQGYTNLLFPSEILFDAAGLTAFHIPMLPGVSLKPGFFARNQSYMYYYPADNGGFAGFAQADTANGSIAIYDVSGPDTILPYTTSLTLAGPGFSPTMWFMAVYMPMNMTAGCSIPSAGASPCALGANGTVTRRFVMTSTVPPMVSITQYAVANNMSSTYATLRAKLAVASGPDFWRQVYAAPLLKLDARVIGKPFANYTSQVFPGIPVPGLLHFMAQEPCGFDCYYPDFLPPDPMFGTTCDMAAMMQAATSQGHITMPYANPTWWDPNSPTLANVTDLTTWAALNMSMQPSFETYPDVPPRTGIATCPYSPHVQARIITMLAKMSWNASTSLGAASLPPAGGPCNESVASIPSTFVFEDQLGARYPKLDYSPYEGGMGYVGYAAGWQEHIRTHASVGLHTEQGVDRLARYALGFHGSVLGDFARGSSNTTWGDANWDPVPMFGAAFRTTVMHFQHDLDGGAQARDFPYLCWSISMGIHLSLDIGVLPHNQTWLNTVSAFQRIAASRYADYAAVSYTVSTPTLLGVTTFTGVPLDAAYASTYSVASNWNGASPLSWSVAYPSGVVSSSTLPAGGCAVASAGLDVVAGIYTLSYNNATLSGSGIHAVVEDRSCAAQASSYGPSVCVLHTSGVDTPLSIVLPTYLIGRSVIVWALNGSNGAIGMVSSTVVNGIVSFTYASTVSGQAVTAYAVTSTSLIVPVSTS